MKLELLIAVILVVLVLLIRTTKKSNHGRHLDRPIRERHRQRTNAPDQGWYRKTTPPVQPFVGRRQQVLSVLREGKLHRGQLVHVLENASLYEFSATELAELRNALSAGRKVQAAGNSDRCKICGMQAVPGEDMCYSHLAR